MTTSAVPALRAVTDAAVLRAAAAQGVERPRLLERLVVASERVIAVSAPAGSGKSTLARQWSTHDPRPHAAMPLSPHLDDPARLAEAVVGALGEIGPGTHRAGARVTALEPDFSAVVLPLISGLVAARSAPFVLVIDDLHLIHAPGCHLLLRTVAESIPEGSHLLLSSRTPMPAWLGRLRVEGEVLDLGMADLAFDAQETRELFQSFGIELDDAEAAAEVDRAEGWAVGLCLSARSGSARAPRAAAPVAPPTDPIGTGERFLRDYVQSEMLEQLSDDDRDFLLRSSVLERLTPETCDALLDRSDSVGRLAHLHDEVLLLLEIDPARSTYRYHHLLERALRDELVRTEPSAVIALNARAAEWYASRGEADDAIMHAKRTRDMALVGRLVWTFIGGCIGSGRPDRLAGWLCDLDEADLKADRWLSLTASWASLQAGRRDEMQRWLHAAQRHAGKDWEAAAADDEYAGSLAVLVALAGRRSLADNVALCVDARRALPPDSPFQAAAAFIEGVCRTLIRDAAGMECLAEAERLGRTNDVPIIESDSLSWQGLLLILAGDAVTGARTISRSLEICRSHDLERLASCAHSVTAQSLALALLHDRSAQEALTRARRLSVQVHDLAPWSDVVLPLVQARAAVALGQGPLARQLVTEAKARMSADLSHSLASDLLRDVEASLRLLSVDGVSAAALTAAEMRVLQFLPSHLTFPQIGEHLFLTSNTVKTHAHSIYRKLSVTSRDDAVLRGQSLGLLESTQGL